MRRVVPVAVILAAAVAGCDGADSSADRAAGDDPVVRATTTAPGTPVGPSPTGSAGGGAASTPGRPAPPDLDRAVRAFSAAYLGGDGQRAYRMLSARCRRATDPDEFAGAAAQLNDQFGRQDIVSLTVETLSGARARVTYKYRVGALDQIGEPWVQESGAWHVDDC